MITKTEHSNVGKLNKRVTFQFYGSTSDGMGGTEPDGSPTDVVTTWASITPISGQELMQQGAMQSNITHRIRLRWRDDLSGKGYSADTYDSFLQANYDGRKFNIQRSYALGEDKTYVEMLATEEVGDEV